MFMYRTTKPGPLENFFGSIRQQGWNSGNPTPGPTESFSTEISCSLQQEIAQRIFMASWFRQNHALRKNQHLKACLMWKNQISGKLMLLIIRLVQVQSHI